MIVKTETALAEAIRDADGPLSIRGGGTRGLAGEGTPLEVSGLSGITLYEPGALTMVAQAGTPIAQIEAALDAEGQRLAFEPMDHRVLLGTDGAPTIGGVIAANVSGPRRIAVGAARDFALGVRIVDGSGAVIKNGGRVMKNVTGYDLVKLMSGAHGTLGVLVEVSFKVMPQPETKATLVLSGLSDRQAVAAMARALSSPFEVTGAAYHAGATLLRLEGFEQSVSYRIERLKEMLGGDASTQTGAASAKTWASVRNVNDFASEAGDVWRVSCKPSEGPTIAARAAAKGVLYDWAGGLLWLLTESGSDLRARLGAYDGHARLVRADAATRTRLGVFEPEAPGVAQLSKALRAKFDPRGILNPGLMG